VRGCLVGLLHHLTPLRCLAEQGHASRRRFRGCPGGRWPDRSGLVPCRQIQGSPTGSFSGCRRGDRALGSPDLPLLERSERQHRGCRGGGDCLTHCDAGSASARCVEPALTACGLTVLTVTTTVIFMTTSSRMASAVHIMTFVAYAGDEGTTSEEIAKSLQTNPVVVRKLLKLLEREGLVALRQGRHGGVSL